MPDPLKPETLEQMRELCKKISVAHDLDPSIQEELLGHMEDKLLAYLTGDEVLSEQDAFILVREHFGDPATVKALMRDAHPAEVQASLARRIGAVFVGGLALSLVSRPLMLLGNVLPREAVLSYSALEPFLSLGVLWLLLLRWQRMIDKGAKPWFLTIRTPVFLALPIVLVMLTNIATVAMAKHSVPHEPAALAPWLRFLWIYMRMTFSCLVWIWWCDRRPRHRFAVGAAVFAWLALIALLGPGLMLMLAIPSGMHAQQWDYLAQVVKSVTTIIFPSAAIALGAYLLIRFYRRTNSSLPLAE